MSNLLRGKPGPDWNKIAAGALALTQILVMNLSEDELIDALWGLSYASGN